jgi:hypothetical protein
MRDNITLFSVIPPAKKKWRLAVGPVTVVILATKSEDSYGSIQMEPAIMQLFLEYQKQATTEFVIESTRPVAAVRWNRY